jgi:adhesin transport system membrane fusion protein
VKSPVKGTVKVLKINTVGGIIQPGMDLVEIVPIEDNLLVEAKIRPADIAFLRPRQDAMVKLTAYDFSIYGGLPAKLERISADTIVDEKDDSFYLIYLTTNKNYIDSSKGHLEIIPGMTTSVDILTGKKTVLDYLLKPILKAKNEALRER